MKRNVVRRGVGAVLVAVTLGVPGLAVAEPAGGLSRLEAAVAELGLGHIWDFLGQVFQADQTPPRSVTNSGEGTNGGGAMDPNGGPPTGGTKPSGNP